MEGEKESGKIISNFFLFYSIWFVFELLTFFIFLIDRLDVIQIGDMIITAVSISFVSFHVVSLILTIPILVHCIRNEFKDSKVKVEWIFFILFFGVFGLALIAYYWIEVAKDEEEKVDELLI